jgi:hypothetical protein
VQRQRRPGWKESGCRGWEECACGVEPVVVEVSESWLVGSQDMAGGSLRAWGSLGKPDTRDSWPFLSEVKAWV